ncbi:unnamed protein product, partial [Symbiodinium pilosum]
VTSAAKQQSACQKLKKPEKQAGVIKDKPAGKGKKASKATTAAAPSAAVEPEIPAPAPAAGGWRQTVICLDLLALEAEFKAIGIPIPPGFQGDRKSYTVAGIGILWYDKQLYVNVSRPEGGLPVNKKGGSCVS